MSIKVAFIGLGNINVNHIKQVDEHCPDTEVVGVCDVIAERAQEVAAQYGAEPFTDYEAMLDETKPDCAYIALPVHIHTGQEEACCQRGIPFLVEKPVARTMRRAKEIHNVIQESGVMCCVGYHWRYAKTTELARTALEGKTIGMILGRWCGGMPPKQWWRTYAQSGGQIVEQTTHVIDAMRYLGGEIESVFAHMSNTNHQGEVDITDAGCVSVRFASGAVGAIINSCLGRNGASNGLEVFAKDFYLKFNQQSITIAGEGERKPEAPPAPVLEQQAFIEAVRTGDRSLIRSDYLDGMKSLAVSLAANQSMETGRPVDVSSLL